MLRFQKKSSEWSFNLISGTYKFLVVFGRQQTVFIAWVDQTDLDHPASSIRIGIDELRLRVEFFIHFDLLDLIPVTVAGIKDEPAFFDVRAFRTGTSSYLGHIGVYASILPQGVFVGIKNVISIEVFRLAKLGAIPLLVK